MKRTDAEGIQKAIQMIAMHGVVIFGQYQESDDPTMAAYYNAQMDAVENIIKDLTRYLKEIPDADQDAEVD